MKSSKIFITSLMLAILSLAYVNADNFNVGVVNFATCIEKSYVGKEENSKLESLRSEMISALESKQKEFQEVAQKLNNPDFMDTISPEAEAELQGKAQSLSQELQMMSQQTDQALQQASMKMLQNLKSQIDNASEYIAREKNLDFILNKESCFYFKRPTDITQLVIKELNRHFEPSEKLENDNSDSE